MEKLSKKIKQIPKSYFSLVDIEKVSDLKGASLKQALSRLTRRGEIFRLVKGVYANDLSQVNWEKMAQEVYASSYLSFEWVLGQSGVLSQKPLHLTFATAQRSRKIEVADMVIYYHHLQPKMFWGFGNKEGVLTAEPEKAFLDLAYLSINGYAKFDPEEMNLSLLDRKKIKQYLRRISYNNLTDLVDKVI